MRGATLRLARLRLRLRQQDIADALCCSRARVGQIEQLSHVPQQWADRYRHALARNRVHILGGADGTSEAISDLVGEDSTGASQRPA